MSIIYWILLSTISMSLISFIGITALSLKERYVKILVPILVALSAGALIGGAFFHLIPESIAFFQIEKAFIYMLTGFVLFFIIEHYLNWRHCHYEECETHTFAHMNLFGEAIHNFIDGLVISAAFIASIPVGISTTIAVAVHEIPQEFGDFGVLIHGGFKKNKALFYNFLASLTAILGGIIGYFFSSITSLSLSILLPIAAGGFIYVGASDLVPEIRKETQIKKSTTNLIVFICGIAIMYLLKILLEI